MQFIDLKAQYHKIQDHVVKAMHNVLDHGQYINGPEVRELEDKLAEFVGVKHAVACSSGTDALLLPMLALGIGPGDEVIVPAFTFFATAEMVSLLGAKVVFADICPKTYLIDPNDVKKKITAKTKAVVAVGLYGQVPPMEDLQIVIEQSTKDHKISHQVYLFEDAAQSFGATRNGKVSGAFGLCGATSFFPAKPLGCYGDGGAFFTDDDDLAQAVREVKEHGSAKRYCHTRIGINGRMDSLQAAVLIEKLKIFPEEVKKRNEIGGRYKAKLSDHFNCMELLSGNTCVYAQFTIEVDNRDQAQQFLKDKGIPTAVHYPMALHKQPIYEKEYGHLSFPNSEKAASRVMSLPMHPYLSEADQDMIVQTLIDMQKN